MDELLPARHEVVKHADIDYATAFVGYNQGCGPLQPRALALDWFEPLGVPQPRPGIILAFGGAFHRGTKEDDVRTELSPTNTCIADYCHVLAGVGYNTFSIDYRLTQEDPHPGFTPTLLGEKVPTSRIDVVRKELGLEPATEEMLRNEQEAAVDDMVSAYRFVSGNAAHYGVDPARIAIGGYSAGGRVAVVAALGEAISPAAVIGLSGVAAVGALDRFHASARRRMPIFLSYGENDLDYVVPGAQALARRMQTAGHPHELWRLPGQSHFYPASAAAESGEGDAATLIGALERFLARALGGS